MCFVVVSDFGAWKKQSFETWPHEGTGQIPHSPGTEDGQMPKGGGGGGCWGFDLIGG